MKKTSFLFIVLGLLSMVASCVVSSQEPVYQERSAYNNKQGMFYERIENQQRRINQGIKSGELDPEGGRDTAGQFKLDKGQICTDDN